jgi:octaprenyl-diphosphate synthase
VNSIDDRLAQLIAPIEGGLKEMRAIIERCLIDESDAVGEMTQHIAQFRGKQLRGSMVLLIGQAHGLDCAEHPTVAAVVEMIHLATLVHDDVLDGAHVRRRVPCVNEKWDNQIAVLLGDFLYARAFGLSTELKSRLCSSVLAKTTQQLCVGEIEQSTMRYQFEMPQETYERIAAFKTGSLYAAACELGARYPGLGEEQGASMRAFGREIGLGFQIIDDCLDVVGEEHIVGKSVGNDIDDGKITLPILRTYQLADESTRSAMHDAYTREGLADRREVLRQVCNLEPGVNYALARADELVCQAMGRLRELPDNPAKRSLELMGEFVLQRNF